MRKLFLLLLIALAFNTYSLQEKQFVDFDSIELSTATPSCGFLVLYSDKQILLYNTGLDVIIERFPLAGLVEIRATDNVLFCRDSANVVYTFQLPTLKPIKSYTMPEWSSSLYDLYVYKRFLLRIDSEAKRFFMLTAEAVESERFSNNLSGYSVSPVYNSRSSVLLSKAEAGTIQFYDFKSDETEDIDVALPGSAYYASSNAVLTLISETEVGGIYRAVPESAWQLIPSIKIYSSEYEKQTDPYVRNFNALIRHKMQEIYYPLLEGYNVELPPFGKRIGRTIFYGSTFNMESESIETNSFIDKFNPPFGLAYSNRWTLTIDGTNYIPSGKDKLVEWDGTGKNETNPKNWQKISTFDRIKVTDRGDEGVIFLITHNNNIYRIMYPEPSKFLKFTIEGNSINSISYYNEEAWLYGQGSFYFNGELLLLEVSGGEDGPGGEFFTNQLYMANGYTYDTNYAKQLIPDYSHTSHGQWLHPNGVSVIDSEHGYFGYHYTGSGPNLNNLYLINVKDDSVITLKSDGFLISPDGNTVFNRIGNTISQYAITDDGSFLAGSAITADQEIRHFMVHNDNSCSVVTTNGEYLVFGSDSSKLLDMNILKAAGFYNLREEIAHVAMYKVKNDIEMESLVKGGGLVAGPNSISLEAGDIVIGLEEQNGSMYCISPSGITGVIPRNQLFWEAD